MYRTFLADKDTYITNKVIKGSRVTGSNVGEAGTLDLFKLYGATMSGTIPNVELSRILIHFDIDKIKLLHQNKKIDVNDSSFWCKIQLKSVYGGQATPSNYSVQLFPLSASFDEGIGRDVTYFTDSDKCNWISSSYDSAWFVSGCSANCFSTDPGDYITGSIGIGSTKVSQFFKNGTEDLFLDVTKIVSATVAGDIPDSGFRISFEDNLETNSKSYFVKRFGSRSAFDESMRPKMFMGFDDSVRDDTQNLTFDIPCRLSLYNYFAGEKKNIISGSSNVTGSNCIILKLSTEISGGNYELFFTGSQLRLGSDNESHCWVTGTYFSDVTLLSSNAMLALKLKTSGSVTFTPVWSSLDGSIAYLTGSQIVARPPTRGANQPTSNYYVNVKSVKETYDNDETTQFRVHIFDQNSPSIKVVKIPVELSGIVLKKVYYSIRNWVTNEMVIASDTVKNATRISSDSEGMFFNFDMSSLTPGTYVIDIIVDQNDVTKTYKNVSPVFEVKA